ncbi:MAG TPA: aminotransferase class I/II-fold pyridoxal phosphate-dependent enzyme [Thermomicrobiales bacterium]|jgi:cystathionine beta-lyase|nr:aminotransferase class I/II-fold pyridoxal phosphate-dependent enzyme [Thermomicrobiales bacterium]
MAEAPVRTANPFADLQLDELRRTRTSAKWRFYPEDVLPLWVAEMDAVVATCVQDAVRVAMETGDTGYPWGNGYAEAVAAFASDRWGWEFEPEQAAKVVDVMTGILEITRVVSNDGDPIILTPPVYPPFAMVANTLERPIVEAPLGPGFRLDQAALESAFREATLGGRGAVMLLSNPHNPTGTIHTREELETVARLANQYGVRVISDEIHAPLHMPGTTYVPYLATTGTERGFSVLSASKGWNLAGFKAALAIPGGESVEDLAKLATRAGNHPGHIAVIAHTAAFRDGQDWLEGAIQGIDHNRKLLTDLLAEHLPAARYQVPEATYLAWVDCRELGLGDDPAAAFLERGKVGLSSGVPFGTGGKGHVRVNLATSPAILTEAVRRMAASVS